jgi:hypothetical protein
MSTEAASSNDPNAMFGMKVDFEFKALAILSVFSLVKLLKPFADNSHLVNLLRSFFLFGHIYFIYIYFDTASRINKSTSRSEAEKAAAKGACASIVKGILIRGVLLFLVHLKTNMLPPLLITVFMGFCSLIENDYYYQVLYSKMPQLFEFMYR